MIDLDKLNVFLHAAESLNFSHTAQQLHVSQPTVSKYISELEHEFNVTLFNRKRGGLQLTNTGKTLVPWARRLLHQSLELEEMMLSLQGEVAGHLKIACSTAAGKYILPRLAARFRRHHPGVQISILTCTQEDVALRLLEDEADLGVVSVEVGGEQMECQRFFTDHIVLIVSEDHPWAKREAIEPDELLDAPMIMREPTSGTRRALLLKLAEHDIGMDDLNVFLELGNAEAIVTAVSSNLGVSFVSKLAAAYALSWGAVVEVPVHDVTLQRQLCMARCCMVQPNRAQEAFWGFIHHPENDDLFALAEA
jgi:DNA-binding transcriptional LysR family regulator